MPRSRFPRLRERVVGDIVRLMETRGELLFDAAAIETMVGEMAGSIASDPFIQSENAVLIGIQTNGVPLARRLAAEIEKKTGRSPQVGTLDISMYRDDIGKRLNLGKVHATEITFDIDDVPVILVDDVLHTGRTIRAALDAITDYGRPSSIKLAVLVDRGGYEFPIRADYAGASIDAGNDDFVMVSWEGDGAPSAWLERRGGGGDG